MNETESGTGKAKRGQMEMGDRNSSLLVYCPGILVDVF